MVDDQEIYKVENTGSTDVSDAFFYLGSNYWDNTKSGLTVKDLIIKSFKGMNLDKNQAMVAVHNLNKQLM